MSKIYLTINIDVNDACFEKKNKLEKWNIGDIIKLRKISLIPGELDKLRGKLIAETIVEQAGDLLLGFAIREKGQLTKILERLKPKGLTISKIYYDGGERRAAKMEEYKKKYDLHSNWLDYSPEFVEHQFQIFEEKVLEIKEEAFKYNIEMEAV